MYHAHFAGPAAADHREDVSPEVTIEDALADVLRAVLPGADEARLRHGLRPSSRRNSSIGTPSAFSTLCWFAA